jgi:hypothetical protein
MPTKIVSVTALVVSLGCSGSFAQNVGEWSLEPLTAPFPCDTIQLNSTGFKFVKTLKITCNGKQFINPVPGSSYSVSYACDHTNGVILLDDNAVRKHPNNLLQVIRNDCAR